MFLRADVTGCGGWLRSPFRIKLCVYMWFNFDIYWPGMVQLTARCRALCRRVPAQNPSSKDPCLFSPTLIKTELSQTCAHIYIVERRMGVQASDTCRCAMSD